MSTEIGRQAIVNIESVPHGGQVLPDNKIGLFTLVPPNGLQNKKGSGPCTTQIRKQFL